LFYTGEGLVGNQEMKRGNLALKNQSKNKYPILVFEKKKPGRYMFLERYRVLGVTTEMQRDINGQKRKVFLFKLRRVSSTYAS
jgi:5-methylcytosine-specific restriction protein A